MARYALCAVAAAAVLGTGVMAATMAPQVSNEANWNDLSEKFRKYHSDHTNIFFHLITTPLGVLSVLSLFNKATNSNICTKALAVVYCLSIMDKMPLHILAITSFVSTGIAMAAAGTASLSYVMHVAMFVVGYFGQDLAHFFTGEQTFQSSYQGDTNFMEQLTEHTYFLLPLVFESTMPPTSKFVAATLAQQMLHVIPMLVMLGMYFVAVTGSLTFPWQFQRSKVCIVRLRNQQDLKDLALIRAWAMSKGPSKTTSTHWWFQAPTPETSPDRCLDKAQKEAFARIAECETIQNMYREVFGENHDIEVLEGMNEVYVSSPHTVKNTSDEVFYTRHIDGPYYFVPFASCYRMIIGLDANEEITTKFPMVPTELAAQNGDVLAFDFHREVHYIEKNSGKTNDDFRIVLKVHHVVYPRWAIFFGKLLGLLSTRYNRAFRSLFLYTIDPNGAFNRFAAWNVIFWTKVVHQLEEKFGYANIGYMAILATLSAFTDYKVFLIGTSFVHYCRYINTYYHRDNVAYGNFKRDVLIYKTIALLQLFSLYLLSVTKNMSDMSAIFSIASLDLAMVVSGYALSMYTTAQLGVDGTYFGIELGFVKASKNYVQKFPYGVIPHPMILSQCVAMLGLYRHAAFRAAWPYLVPAHVCCYMTHMVQEHFDIHKKRQSPSTNAAAEKLA